MFFIYILLVLLLWFYSICFVILLLFCSLRIGHTIVWLADAFYVPIGCYFNKSLSFNLFPLSFAVVFKVETRTSCTWWRKTKIFEMLHACLKYVWCLKKLFLTLSFSTRLFLWLVTQKHFRKSVSSINASLNHGNILGFMVSKDGEKFFS